MSVLAFINFNSINQKGADRNAGAAIVRPTQQ
jgi:hypothetical protein